MSDPNKSSVSVTWPIIATAGWVALSGVLLFWMQNVSTRLDKVSDDVSSLRGWIQAHDKTIGP